MDIQERTVPARSKDVGPESRGCPSAEVCLMGEACAMAIKQAMKSIVLGEGEGIGEDGPTRCIVLLLGVELKLPFSFSSGGRSNVGVRKMIFGRVGGFVVSCCP